MRSRILLLSLCAWALSACDEDPEPAPDTRAWLLTVHADLPGHDPTVYVAVAPPRPAFVVTPAGETPAHSVDHAVEAALRGELLTIAAAPGAPADAVWDLAGGAFRHGAREVRLAARVGAAEVYLPLWPTQPIAERGDLALTVSVHAEGTRVFGAGGWLRPGCEEIGRGLGYTASAGMGEVDAVGRCLAEVGAVFPDERHAHVRVADGVSFGRLLAIAVAARGESDRFAVHLQPSDVSDDALQTQLASAPAETVTDEHLHEILEGALNAVADDEALPLPRVEPLLADPAR